MIQRIKRVLICMMILTTLCTGAVLADGAPDADVEAGILEAAEGYMADVLSMNERERNAAVVTLAYDEKQHVWQVYIAVKGQDLSDNTKDLLNNDYCEKLEYDVTSDTYYHYWLYDVNGHFVEGRTSAGYEFSHMVPREAYPVMPEKYAEYEYFDPLKCFLYSSAAEKAAFSQEYKPVIDEWFEQHPRYAEWLASQNHYLYWITRNRYGAPAPNMLQEGEVLQIAYEYSASHFIGASIEALMTRYDRIVYFDVTDPDAPVWKVLFIPDVEMLISEDVCVDFYVVIDVWTGKVIRDQNTLNETDVEFHHGRWPHSSND